MTLDEALVREVDQAARRLRMSRSGFTRRALRSALESLEREELERRHREGYRKHPARPGEFDRWETEQVWGDE